MVRAEVGGQGSEVLGYYLGGEEEGGPVRVDTLAVALKGVSLWRLGFGGEGKGNWTYHGGSGFEFSICCWREAREFVRRERRWRVCSRTFISWGVRDVILGGG